jgi:hypothetical protein
MESVPKNNHLAQKTINMTGNETDNTAVTMNGYNTNS